MALASASLKANTTVNFYGKLIEVVSPSTIMVANSDGDTVLVSIQGPFFGDIEHKLCAHKSKTVTYACDLIEDRLKGEKLGVIFETYAHGILRGDIVFGDTLLSEDLIYNGEYKVNAEHSRAQYLLIAERDALCKFKGIWQKHKGKHEYAAICQAR